MGAYLSTPILTKDTTSSDNYLGSPSHPSTLSTISTSTTKVPNSTDCPQLPNKWSATDVQGWRKSMEDSHITDTNVSPPKNKSFSKEVDRVKVFGVFDGHGGAECARFCERYFVDVLTSSLVYNNIPKPPTNLTTPLLLNSATHDKTYPPASSSNNNSKERDSEDNSDEFNNGFSGKQSSGELTPYYHQISRSLRATFHILDLMIDDKRFSEELAQLAVRKYPVYLDSEEDRLSDIIGDSSVSGINIDNVRLNGESKAGNGNTNENERITTSESISIFHKLLQTSSSKPKANIDKDAPQTTSDSDNQPQNGRKQIPTTSSSTLINGKPTCILPDHPIHAGCTACVALIINQTLTVANAGDSRAVLLRANGHVEAMSYDHKPDHPFESLRIKNAGGFINAFGRVNGNLNLSRSIGDLKYKQNYEIKEECQMITAEANTITTQILKDDEFLVVGCDGIWDCLSNVSCCAFISERIESMALGKIVEEMLDEIVADDPRASQGVGGDNMTVLIVDFRWDRRKHYLDSLK